MYVTRVSNSFLESYNYSKLKEKTCIRCPVEEKESAVVEEKEY